MRKPEKRWRGEAGISGFIVAPLLWFILFPVITNSAIIIWTLFINIYYSLLSLRHRAIPGGSAQRISTCWVIEASKGWLWAPLPLLSCWSPLYSMRSEVCSPKNPAISRSSSGCIPFSLYSFFLRCFYIFFTGWASPSLWHTSGVSGPALFTLYTGYF